MSKPYTISRRVVNHALGRSRSQYLACGSNLGGGFHWTDDYQAALFFNTEDAVKRFITENPGVMEYTSMPTYGKCK